MAENRKKVTHIRSNALIEGTQKPKLPDASILEYGEIAINYLAGKETISIRNSSNEIATFSSDNQITSLANEVEVGSTEPASESGVEIFIYESVDPLTVEIYTKSEIDTKVGVLNQANEDLQGSIDGKVLVGDKAGFLQIDENEDSSVEVYTKAQVDALFLKLKQMNPSIAWS